MVEDCLCRRFDTSNKNDPDHVVYSTHQTVAGENKTEGSNTIMSTSFALEFRSNEVIDVDIIISN